MALVVLKDKTTVLGPGLDGLVLVHNEAYTDL